MGSSSRLETGLPSSDSLSYNSARIRSATSSLIFSICGSRFVLLLKFTICPMVVSGPHVQPPRLSNSALPHLRFFYALRQYPRLPPPTTTASQFHSSAHTPILRHLALTSAFSRWQGSLMSPNWDRLP